MNNQNATVRSRQELKTLFDSGAITAEEYEAYKKRIIYGIAIPVKPQPSASALVGSSASPFSVKPIETKIIYPAQQATPKPPVRALSDTEQNHYKEKSLIGVEPARRKKWVLISLAVLGTLLLLNLFVYLFLNKPNSERITRKSETKIEKILPADLPQANLPIRPAKTNSERSDRIPLASTNKSVVTRPIPDAGNSNNSTKSTIDGMGHLTDENEIIRIAHERLNAYYTDIQAAPFRASQYFAPQVERYYTLSNTTPAAITKNINTYHFSEFLNGQSTIQEGSMKVVNMSNNSYELTYLENGSAFRKSKNQKQEVKATVRVRFNPDFKITYFRQERLLKNRFSTE